MRHPALVEFEEKLKRLFDETDDFLEHRYGELFPLHPARASRGRTANKEQDGLFNVGASFSAGFGSEIGRGYVIDVRMVTLAHIPDYVRSEIEVEAVRFVSERLPVHFPERDMRVSRERNHFKIHGDLSLGAV